MKKTVMGEEDLKKHCEYCGCTVLLNRSRMGTICITCNIQRETDYCLNCKDEFSYKEMLCETCYDYREREEVLRTKEEKRV